MRILVCGGRNYSNYKRLSEILLALHNVEGIDTIISGHARGADSLGELWARMNSIKLEVYPADWKKHGLGAGPVRNQQMLDEGKPDLIVAFPGGSGTRDMINRSKLNDIKVMEIDDSETRKL